MSKEEQLKKLAYDLFCALQDTADEFDDPNMEDTVEELEERCSALGVFDE